ncbi:hypothetical protein EDB83DRAFT_2521314 [Lactarius deliciosus]|nr:hypothetical protein EDB83DRAFT_2521314 [Lactarius deliciosus]
MPPKPKPPAPPITIQQIAGALNSVISGLDELLIQDAGLSGEARHVLNHFLTNPTITNITGIPTQTPAPTPLPASLLKDLKDIKSSILALQKVSPAGTQPSKKPPQSNPPAGSPQEPNKKTLGATISSFAKAAALPPCPSVVISLANINWSGLKPSPAQVCKGINDTLDSAQNDQVCISAARWTAKENLVLTGSPNTTVQSLQLDTPTIRLHFSERYPDSHATSHPIKVQPNVKWSKILINSVPTGVSSTSSAHMPDSCHTALIDNNPNYASLTITQRPSWVRNPTSYTNDTVSLLVVAFEDPDGSHARDLLATKVLYIFGNCTTLRKWKQRPSTRKTKNNPTHNSPTHSPHESVPTSPIITHFNFSAPPDPDPDPAPRHARPNTRSTQDMKGESDNAGRSRTATRSSDKTR